MKKQKRQGTICKPPIGYDWVGYEDLIKFLNKNNILKVPGDFIEIGTLFGGGAKKLSNFLTKNKSNKTLIVIDIFDLKRDNTKNTNGDSMSQLYIEGLKQLNKKNQKEAFLFNTKNCKNIKLIKKDTKKIKSLHLKQISFGFIDGHHNPSYVKNDFYLIWNKLSSNGCIAFHDYNSNLPLVTKTINMLLKKHKKEILKTCVLKKNWVLFLIKK